MSKNLIDTHFHLDHFKNHSEIYKEINKLKQYTICVTNSPRIFNSCKRLYPETKFLKFALGMHPNMDSRELRFPEFQTCFNQADYIGEIGLDFTRKTVEEQEGQLRRFENILRFANSYGKPASIHIKSAYSSATELLAKYPSKQYIIHWFSGSESDAMDLVNLGCFFSINAQMLTPKFKEISRLIPREKILIESDAPFAKVSGRIYSPDKLGNIYASVSEFLNIEELNELVYANFRQLLMNK